MLTYHVETVFVIGVHPTPITVSWAGAWTPERRSCKAIRGSLAGPVFKQHIIASAPLHNAREGSIRVMTRKSKAMGKLMK